MARPRILLCPQFTEVEWTIAPQLAEWAEVATFDSPGFGDEPLPGDPDDFGRELVVQRALQELDRLGWNSYFLVSDAFGHPTAARIAAARPEPVLGLALGHACVDCGTEGARPAVNKEVLAAMTQLISGDFDSFVRYGFTQFTQGGFDEETSARLVARFPSMEFTARAWKAHTTPEPIAELLAGLDAPILLAEHEGCLVFTKEGYEDAVSALPGASTTTVHRAPSASDEFAAALRDFCESVLP